MLAVARDLVLKGNDSLRGRSRTAIYLYISLLRTIKITVFANHNALLYLLVVFKNL